MTSWFRRQRDALAAPDAEDEADKPAALLVKTFEVAQFVNASAGRLPGEAVVISRRITDAVRHVIETAEERPLEIYTIISIRGVLDDYLPTTLRKYLALDPGIVDVPRPSGTTPSQSLLEQLYSLWSGVTDLANAARSQDADALLSQGNFLRTKFTGSDLDL